MGRASLTYRLACVAVFTAALTANLSGQSVNPGPSHTGLDLNAIDTSVDPCNNFYLYACGKWIKDNPIPPDESTWSRFDELFQRNQQVLRGILEEAEHQQNLSSIDAKIGRFYESCMDEAGIEKRGTEPLRSELERIARIANGEELRDEMARLQSMQVAVFFSFDSTPDPKDARMTIAELDQGGIGLPEKDYYFRDDETSKNIRQKYIAHIAKVFELIGVSPTEAAAKAVSVMALETSLAKASLDVTSRRDPQKLVHEMPKTELETLTPAFNFNQFFVALKIPS